MDELSDAALALLRRRLAGERIQVDESSRPIYRELAEAGLVDPIHTLTGGRDSHYRLTLLAMEHKFEFLNASNPSPSPEESAV